MYKNSKEHFEKGKIKKMFFPPKISEHIIQSFNSNSMILTWE